MYETLDYNERFRQLETKVSDLEMQVEEYERQIDRLLRAVFSGSAGSGMKITSSDLAESLQSPDYVAGPYGGRGWKWTTGPKGRLENYNAFVQGDVVLGDIWTTKIMPAHVCGYRIGWNESGDPRAVGPTAGITTLYLVPWDYDGVYLADPLLHIDVEDPADHVHHRKLVRMNYYPIPLTGLPAGTKYDLVLHYNGNERDPVPHAELIPWANLNERETPLVWNNGGWWEIEEDEKLWLGTVQTTQPGTTSSQFIFNYFATN